MRLSQIGAWTALEREVGEVHTSFFADLQCGESQVDVERQAIAARELPSGISLRVWGGRGSGKICSLCGRPIGSDDVEIELDGIEREGGVRFHSKCHLLWQEACKGPDH